MKSIVTPIITAIVYKTLFKRLVNMGSYNYPKSTASQKIYENLNKFDVIGLPSEDEMRVFAGTYLNVIDARNEVAHSASGDDIIRCLKYMDDDDVRMVVTYGFQAIFDCAIENWKYASQMKKLKRIYNSMLIYIHLI